MNVTLPDNLVAPSLAVKSIINDFSITVGTQNGSGSQTSNITILRAIIKMGIPASGKNLFPSNIQGLPTWYTIRVSKDGFLARQDQNQIVIAMNPDSFSEDLTGLVPGGVLLYPDDIKFPINRTDITIYPMPVKKFARESDAPTSLRNYIANMAYVGTLANLIGINLETIYQALDFHFKGKEKPIDMNFSLVKKSYEWAEANIEKNDPYWLEPMNLTHGKIMTDGNTAAALGSIYGGVHFAAWYPITPASTLAEELTEYLPILRKDTKTNKNTYAVIQAEDELAAIGMAVGAGFAGLRSMTSTSGPGLSLMTEYIGLAYYAEVPVVIWDVQRAGPSTGLPTRTSQGDLSFVAFMGHGDTQSIMLLPGSVFECFEFGWKAFDIAEQLQAPVIVMSDLDIGMNQWVTEPFEYPDTPINRGKILWEEDLENWKGKWGRYLDVDQDGIPYRTAPGNTHPLSAYFARGTGHDEFARYSENNQEYEQNMTRLKKKYDNARQYMPKPIVKTMEDATIGIIAFGSTDSAIQEARHLLTIDGIETNYLRLRAIPLTSEVYDFIGSNERIYVVEMNRDGQLHQLLSLEYINTCAKLISIAHLDGLPMTAKWVVEQIKGKEAR